MTQDSWKDRQTKEEEEEEEKKMSLPVYHHPLRVVLLLYSVLFSHLKKKSLTSKSRIIKRDSGNGSQRLKDEEEEDGIEDCY